MRAKVPAGTVGADKPEPEDPSPVMPVEDTEEEVLRIARYRTIGLLDLGFDLEQTLKIVHLPDVVHTAEYLLGRKWPHEWIVDTLAPEDE